MTRKDYILIADSIKTARENWEGFTPEAQEAIDGLARGLASKLAGDNDRFKTSTNTAENGFDYDVQAWYAGGVYVRCGHPDAMACQCYGRIHEGEKVSR